MTLTRRACLGGLAALPFAAAAGERFIILGSTTTTENSGLLAHLIPLFEAETGIGVRVVVAGTGKVLKLAENGDIDAALVHDRVGEEAFVAAGRAAYRRDAMYNDFLIVGPAEDPAGVRGAPSAAAALRRIAAAGAPFISRADDSGTHRRERELWGDARPSGDWYRETGSGMGATLNVAVGSGAYTLVDRGTWAAFGDVGDLVSLCEGDPALLNEYGVLLPTPARHPHQKTAEAEAFIGWLISDKGRAAIASFRIDGEQVFFPPDRP